ncbi:DUF805 domain-containing protein [Psychromonas sp. PT13]|uniref:DUF805 domain-containing protein n=1 Tax=Psychromonas sp. PT13 TaxID=3439547 RepID=UPI003EB7DDF8
MKGKVAVFNETDRSGTILGADDNEYHFSLDGWKGADLPRLGHKVDFTINGESAEAIFGDPDSPEPLTIPQILFSFKGRIGRKAFWLSSLGMLAVVCILMVIFGALGLDENTLAILTLLITLPLVWISLAVQIKRWHDRNKSGFWIFITLVPLIGSVWALIENGFLEGDTTANNYGAPSY